MKEFKERFPTFFEGYTRLLQQWQKNYLRTGRHATYVGSSMVMALSNFGHQYVFPITNLESLKPLFKPNPGDLSISSLVMSLHKAHKDYLFLNLQSCFHALNCSHIGQGSSKVHLFDENKELLLLWAQNFYLNEMQDTVNLRQIFGWQDLQDTICCPSSLLHCMENGENRPWQTIANPSIDIESFEESISTPKGITLEKLLNEDELLRLQAIVIDNSVRMPDPDDDFSMLTLLNPYCYFLLRLGKVHAKQWPITSKKWCERGYEFWQLPNLKPYHGPTSPYSRWVIMAQPTCFS